MVVNLVQIELAYINTKHPDFTEASIIQRSLNQGELSGRDSIDRMNNSFSAPPTPLTNGHQNGTDLKKNMANLNLNNNGKLIQFQFNKSEKLIFSKTRKKYFQKIHGYLKVLVIKMKPYIREAIHSFPYLRMK